MRKLLKNKNRSNVGMSGISQYGVYDGENIIHQFFALPDDLGVDNDDEVHGYYWFENEELYLAFQGGVR